MVSRPALLLALILLLVFAQTGESSSAGPEALDASRRDAEAAITAAQVSSQEAFLQIKGANQEGGNVTALAGRFNEALELLDRAKVLMDEGLLDQAVASAESAEGLFKAVGSEGEVLRVQAAADASTWRTAVLLAAPVAVILITVFSYVLIRVWQRRRMERTMEMEIREAGTP